MIRIAALILCHINAERINRLLSALSDDSIDVYVHVDKKSKIKSEITIEGGNVIILPDELRIDVKWAQYSQVEATLNLINYASSMKDYDFYILLSGDTYPISSITRIKKLLESNRGSNFINLVNSKSYQNNGKLNNFNKRNSITYPQWMLNKSIFHRLVRYIWVQLTGGYCRTYKLFERKNLLDVDFYYGSQWWCLSGDFVKWLKQYLTTHPMYMVFFKKCSTPDESFFQTLLMNSPFVYSRKDYLYYIDWSLHNNSPKELTLADYDRIITSGKLFARKINDKTLLDKIDCFICSE